MRNEQFEELFKGKFSKKSTMVTARSGNHCYAYNRVSSKEQMDNGNSLKWQEERIVDFARKQGYTIKKMYGGTYESAKTDERKEFKQMLDDIKKDKAISKILVYSYDRFSRSGTNSLYLTDNLNKLGVTIIAVTQEIDTSTPAGSFQQHLYMLMSKLDNDMRKDKCIAGTKSLLKQGYWTYGAPRGYTNINKNTTADKHVYIINEDGQKLKKAFLWKASGKYTNQQIIDKLKLLGLKINIRHIAWILANPFYCGYISVAHFPGEIFKGKHPALIDEDTFLKANKISLENPRAGIKKQREKSELPLKLFMRDAISGSPLTGYLNKKKQLYYYKSIQAGSKLSVSAKKLNGKFEELISHFQYDEKYKNRLRAILTEKLKTKLAVEEDDKKSRRKRLSEIKGQLDKIEERFVLGEITQEQYRKYASLYGDQLEKIRQEIDQSSDLSSNLEKAVERGLDYAQNLRQMWVVADYFEKQRLQYLVFPEGMMYDKQTDQVLTTRINSLFGEIAVQASVCSEDEKGNQLKDCLLGSSVVPTRIELVSKV